MRITKYGAKILRKVARDVRDDYPTGDMASSMFSTLKKNGGVGLALPQVGESKRMFVINVDGLKRTFVNPTIEYLGEKVPMMEGCLSIPGIEMEVFRHEKVRVHYWTSRWNEKTEEFSGLAARVIQHEYDHLDGILFIDYLSEEERKSIRQLLDKISNTSEKSVTPRFNTGGYNYGSTRGRSYFTTSNIVIGDPVPTQENVEVTEEVPMDDQVADGWEDVEDDVWDGDDWGEEG